MEAIREDAEVLVEYHAAQATDVEGQSNEADKGAK